MHEYNKRDSGSPDPSLGLLEEASSHFSSDSGDADDFDADLLFYSDDDDCDYQSPADELTWEEKKMLEELVPIAEDGIIQLLYRTSGSGPPPVGRL